MYTGIEIVGFSISLMFVILIGVYTWQEFSTDRHQENAGRIYILGNDMNMMAAYGIGERVMDRFPEIERVLTLSSTTSISGETVVPVESNDRKASAQVFFTNEYFFDFFPFELTLGNKDYVMQQPNSAVISETFARTMFPGTDPIGQVIHLTRDVTVTVSGIMKDISRSVVPYTDILVRMEKLTEMAPYITKDRYDSPMNSIVFLLAGEGTDLHARTDDMTAYLSDFYWIYRDQLCKTVVLTPFRQAYFGDYGNFTILEKGNYKFVVILLSIALIILLFAVINYINLSVAQTGFRAKEVAIRELLGSSKTEAFKRLMIESVCLTFISFVLGVVFAFLAVPFANNLLETRLDLPGAVSLPVLFLIGISILLIGAVSGLLPAVMITYTKAVDIVKGTFRQRTKMVFSKCFIVFQNTITIGMVVASLVMVLQINHLLNAPLGYQTANIIDIPLKINNENLIRPLSAELNRLPEVSQVGLAMGTPFDKGYSGSFMENDQLVTYQNMEFDTVAFDMLGLEIVHHTNLASDEGYYLNRQALEAFNIAIDDKTIDFNTLPFPLAGEVKDFQLYNITYENSPVTVRINRSDFHATNVLVKIQGDPVLAWNKVKEVYDEVTGLEFHGKYIDQQIRDSFEVQRRTARIVLVFCFVTIIISLMGLLAMSTYFIRQRTREIAVRKVFGSENRQILLRLVLSFLSYVGIAFVIATPVIYYIMRDWLTGYSYRIHLNPVIFISGGIFCTMIAFLTVLFQSYQAANQDPAQNIKAD